VFTTSPTLREWQKIALREWRQQGFRGIVEVVTGGGKTIFAQACMRSFAETHPECRYLIVVPTVALLDQWHVSLREDLGVPTEVISTFPNGGDTSAPTLINIMVMNSARTKAEVVSNAGATMLIVDECHRAGSEANAHALRGQHVATLGLSATPERQYDEGLEKTIVPALGPIIYRYGLDDASRDQVIAPFELVNVSVEMLEDEATEYKRLSRALGRLVARVADADSKEKLEALLRRRARVAASAAMRVPVAARIVERHRGVRTLIFHEDIGEAEKLGTLLRARNHSVTIYHSRIAASVRRDNLRLFRRGVFDVLVSCRALDEGVNIPETRVAIIASATASSRQRIQRLGRVLRPAPGKDSATVYTLYASAPEARRLQREAQDLATVRQVLWTRSTLKRA